MQKTLGGDRLGAGKKIKVDMHGWNRSSFDQSRVWRSTMTPGVLTPCFVEVGTNGTTFDIDINTLAHTIPAIAPLFGSFKMQVDFFSCPFRIYQGLLHNNMTEIGMEMNKVLLPKIDVTYDQNKGPEDFAKSSLMCYMGSKGITEESHEYSALPILAYYDIFKNYYMNKQEETAKVITNVSTNVEIEPSVELTIKVNDNQYISKLINVTQVSPNNFTIENANFNIVRELKLIFTDSIENIKHIILGINNTLTSTSTSVPIDINPKITKENKQPIILRYETEGETLKLIIGHYYITDFGEKSKAIVIENNNIDESNAINLESFAFQNIYNEIKIVDFDIKNLDKARRLILKKADKLERVIIRESNNNEDINFMPYVANATNEDNIALNAKELQGLLLKTYQNDIYNTWLSTEYVNTINNISSITPGEDGKFTIDALILAKKVYNVLNRIAISGGSYQDWQEAVYGQQPISIQESPLYIGGASSEITFEEVVSTAGSDANGTQQPLATLGGKGVVTNRKGGKIVYKCNEPCFIIGICSITPRVDYHQGNKWYMTELDNMDNLHKPEYDGIGFQNLIANNVHWRASKEQGLAKQTAWINYQTAVNEVFGDFAKADEGEKNSLFYMSLRRNYEVDGNGNITDFTSYVDPRKYNHIFANEDIDAQNFWVQLGFNVTSRRLMASYEIPNL